MGRIACIDVGTVTCRVAVADVEGGRVTRLAKSSTIVNLGEGLTQTGRISSQAIERLLSCVDAGLEAARSAGAESVCCTLTSASRDAANSDELLAELADRGLRAQVIPGDIEARLTFLGVSQDFPGQTILVADNGGGSTELALGRLEADGLDLAAVRSVDVGCRRVTDMFLSREDPPNAEDLAKAHAFAAKLLGAAADELGLREGGADALVCTGGTATSLVAMEAQLKVYDSAFVHLHELTLESTSALEEQLAHRTLADRAKMIGLQPQRAPVILAGTIIVGELMRVLGFDALRVSESDLLFGLSLTADAVASGRPSPLPWEPTLAPLA